VISRAIVRGCASQGAPVREGGGLNVWLERQPSGQRYGRVPVAKTVVGGIRVTGLIVYAGIAICMQCCVVAARLLLSFGARICVVGSRCVAG